MARQNLIGGRTHQAFVLQNADNPADTYCSLEDAFLGEGCPTTYRTEQEARQALSQIQGAPRNVNVVPVDMDIRASL